MRANRSCAGRSNTCGIDGEAEGDLGRRQRQPAQSSLGGVGFGAGGFEEFAAGGRGVEQILDRDAGAGCAGCGGDGRDHAARDLDPVGAVGTRHAGYDGEPGGGAMLGSASPRKPSVRMRTRSPSASLLDAMALNGERQVGLRHAAPIVGDVDAFDAAAGDGGHDAGGAGIQRFSTSSFTAAAGRSITSPAAMRFTMAVGSSRIACAGIMRSVVAGEDE